MNFQSAHPNWEGNHGGQAFVQRLKNYKLERFLFIFELFFENDIYYFLLLFIFLIGSLKERLKFSLLCMIPPCCLTMFLLLQLEGIPRLIIQYFSG